MWWKSGALARKDDRWISDSAGRENVVKGNPSSRRCYRVFLLFFKALDSPTQTNGLLYLRNLHFKTPSPSSNLRISGLTRKSIVKWRKMCWHLHYQQTVCKNQVLKRCVGWGLKSWVLKGRVRCIPVGGEGVQNDVRGRTDNCIHACSIFVHAPLVKVWNSHLGEVTWFSTWTKGKKVILFNLLFLLLMNGVWFSFPWQFFSCCGVAYAWFVLCYAGKWIFFPARKS